MSVALIKRITANYNLRVPNWDMIGWGRELERDLDIIDAVLFASTGIGAVVGVWLNSTGYVVGNRLVDAQDGRIYQCLVNHTSAAAPTLFAADRVANPTFWQILNADVHNRGQWTTATAYNENEFVTDAHRVGITLLAFTSGASYDADVGAGRIETIIDMSFYANIPADDYIYGAENTSWRRIPTAIPGGEWKFDNTVGGAPASGFLRYNNATLASVTAIHVHKTDAVGLVQTPTITLIAQAGVDLFFGSEKNENVYDVFSCVALPTDAGAYFTIPVTYKTSGTGGAMPNVEYCRFSPIGGAGSKVTTDDVAPTGPLDGQMWWDSVGGKLYVFYDDGVGAGQWVEASGADVSGNGVNLAGYSVQAINTNTQAILTATPTLVTNMTTIEHDPSSFWNGSRFQPTKAGLYLIKGSVGMVMDGTAGRLLICFLYKNGVVYARLGSITSGGINTLHLSVGALLVLMNGSTDYLELFVQHTNAATTDLVSNATQPRSTVFSATFLGEAGMPQIPEGTALQNNLLVNPSMQSSQQNGNTAAATDNYFGADQWSAVRVTSAGVVNFGQVSSKTPRGSKHRLRATVATADVSIAAGEVYIISQRLEGTRLEPLGWDGATGVQLVVRFGFRGPAGTYSLSLRNGAHTRSWVSNFTVTAGQANTDIEITKVIPPDTTGGVWANDTTEGASLSIAVMSGTTFITTPDAWQTGNFVAGTGISNGLSVNTNVFELFDAGSYPDPEMTGLPPEWIAPLFVQSLAESMRYWWTGVVTVEAAAVAQNFNVPHMMRIAPTITGGGAGFSVSLAGNPTMLFSQTTRASQTLTFNARM